jgi:hypothetical protein
MSVLFFESFDYYNAVATKWKAGANSGGVDLSGTLSRTGIGCCVLGTPFGPMRVLPSHMTRVIYGTAVVPNGLPCKALRFSTAAGGNLIVGIDTDLSVTYWVYFGFDAQGGKSAPGVCTLNGYNYLEVDAVASATLGSVTIRVNGVQVFSISNVNTVGFGPAYFDCIQLGGCGGLGGTIHDDVYVVDPATTPNNSFQGAVRVYRLLAGADSTPLQWTPSVAGPHYPLVNSVPPDLTKWVQSSTPGQTDQYLYPLVSIPSSVTVKAVQHSLLAALDAAGSRSIASSVEGIVSPTSFSLSTSESQYSTPYDVDPSTGAPWLLSDIGTRKIGPTVTA